MQANHRPSGEFKQHAAVGVSPPAILVADDDADAREMLRILLLSVGFRVVTAQNGAQALETARRMQLDLVITDHQMPTMTGVTLCRRLRDDELTRHVPIILYTGMSLPASSTSSCDKVVSKPADPEELLALVHLLLRRPH